MKALLPSIAGAVFNALYALCCAVQKRRDEVLLLSRQFDEPSYNFKAVGDEFERRGWEVVYLTKRLSKRSVVPYCFHVLREIKHLARCRVCFLDRYDPVVGLLNFACEDVSYADSSALHTEFPCEPVIVQLWHAFGAFKKFGYQSLGTIEGHSPETARLFGIHRNYSWVLCTGESSRLPFAEAFSYPVERVVPLGLPEYDKLRAIREERAAKAQGERAAACRPLKVLFAPTLRKSAESRHPFRELRQLWGEVPDNLAGVEITWSFHPLEEGVGAAVDVSEALLDCDIVVTDYSSIVYEAYVLGKLFAFYVPDLDEYRESPGLNADPAKLAPEIVFFDERALRDFLAGIANLAPEERSHRCAKSLDGFAGGVFKGCPDNTAAAIADFALAKSRR